jgi:hypothetical protein
MKVEHSLLSITVESHPVPIMSTQYSHTWYDSKRAIRFVCITAAEELRGANCALFLIRLLTRKGASMLWLVLGKLAGASKDDRP